MTLRRGKSVDLGGTLRGASAVTAPSGGGAAGGPTPHAAGGMNATLSGTTNGQAGGLAFENMAGGTSAQSAQYAGITMGIAAEKKTPQTTRGTVLRYDLYANDDFDPQGHTTRGGQSFQNQYRKQRGLALQPHGRGSLFDNQRQLAGPPFVWQLMIDHLKKSPASQVALTVQSELRDMGIQSEYYLVDHSPIDLGSKATSLALQAGGGGLFAKDGGGADVARGGELGAEVANATIASALTQVLCPASHTREGIMALLRDTVEKLKRQRQIPTSDPHMLLTLAKQAVSPMWLPPASSLPAFESVTASVASSPTLAFSKASGNLLAASVNELVEQMSSVQLTPHLGISSKSTQLNERLCMEVFLTCEHFTTRHALLAKLLQRFHVPAVGGGAGGCLGLKLSYNKHGIFIDIPSEDDAPSVAPKGLLGPNGCGIGPMSVLLSNLSIDGSADEGGLANAPPSLSPSACLQLAVTRLVQLKVSSVIAMWAHYFPQHFDSLMRECVFAWIDECCMGFGEWCDSASELQCCAESVRCSLWEASMGGGFDASTPPSLMRANPTPVLSSAAPAYLFRATSRPPPRQVNTFASLKASCKSFLGLSPDTLASLMHSIDYQLLKAVNSEELYTVAMVDAFRMGGVGVGGASGRDATNELLNRFEATSMWILNQLLDSLEVDLVEGGGNNSRNGAGVGAMIQSWPTAIDTLHHVLTLCFRLLAVNDFHSCLAVFSAVLHPSYAIAYKHVLKRFASTNTNNSLKELVRLFDFSNNNTPSSSTFGGLSSSSASPTSSGVYAYKAALADCSATASVNPPIPLLHVIIDELRAIETSQPTLLCDDGAGSSGSVDPSTASATSPPIAVHWRKMSVIATIYQQVRSCQQASVVGGDLGLASSVGSGGMGGALDGNDMASAPIASKVRWLDSIVASSSSIRTKDEMVDVSTRVLRHAMA